MKKDKYILHKLVHDEGVFYQDVTVNKHFDWFKCIFIIERKKHHQLLITELW